MTKTILTIVITLYSLARLVFIAIAYYYNTMRLPLSVVVVSAICSALMLLIALRCYTLQLSGKNLRFALLIGALTAVINMVLITLDQPGTLSMSELVITGTVFDILLFIGSCTIKIRNTRGTGGRSPFARRAESGNDITTS